MKRAALFVGIDRYESPEINGLACAEKDAADLHAFFQYAAGYDDVRRLLSPDTDRIVSETEELMRTLDTGDQFLFYFAGHGTEHNGKHLLLDSKARREMLPFNYHVLPVEMLKAMTSHPGLHRIFMLDCCRNDLFKGRGGGKGMRDAAGWRDIAAVGDHEPEAGALTILCSCDEGHQAAELEGQGLFTASILNCLQAARQDGRCVSLNDTFEQELTRHMSETARRLGRGTQRPWIQRSGAILQLLDGRGEPAGSEAAKDRPLPAAALSRPPSPSKVKCPSCGLRNDPDETFECRECGRDYLCRDHFVRKQRCCEDCAAKRPAQAAKGEEAAQACEGLQAGAGDEQSVDLGDGVKLELVWIPAGGFTMGSPADERDRSDKETQHRVTLTKGFWLGKYEVTQEQYQQVTGSNPSKFKGAKNPVESVSWDDAKAFCEVLAKKLGKTVRLPTEAEWEYVCRAGTTTRFYTGDSESRLAGAAWYSRNCDDATHPVGEKKPNAWGLYDMHGNVWEWCEDWYGGYPSGNVTDPRGPAYGSLRVIRGGSWSGFASYCRVGYRFGNYPDSGSNYVGFRACLPPGQ